MENGADYSVDSIGATLHTTSQLKRDDNGFIRRHYGTALSPDIGITINDDATSSTKSAVAPGVVTIRSNEKDALGQILRSAENSLNALDKIFDKETVKEKKELAEVFAQTMNQSIGDLAEHMRRNARTPEERAKWAEGDENILLLRALGSGLASALGGKGFLSGAVGSAAQDIFAKEISKIHDDNLQLLAGMLVGGATAKLLGGDMHAGTEAAFHAIKYNRHGHRRYYDGEVTYHNGRYYQYDAKKDLDVEIHQPQKGMIVWVDDGDGSSMGWDCEITEEGQDPDDFRRLQGNYAYLGIGKDGKPIFFESNETLSEELHLKPTQEPSIPFRGRRRGHMDYFAEGLMQSGIDAGEELLDAGMHPWKFFMEIRGLADEIAKKPALAAQIPPALLSELFSDLDDFNNVDSKEQAAKLGKTTGKLLIFLAPGGAAAKGINLSKYPRLLKLFNKAEARGTNKDASHSLASDSKPQTNNIPAYVRDRRIPLDSETVLRNPKYRFTGRTRDHVKIYKKGDRYYYRDTKHFGKSAHLEVFDKRGKHLGEADPQTGEIRPGTADSTKKLEL